jgi:hypothetical protein
MLSRNWKISSPAFALPAITALNTTTPRVAPSGSANVPSRIRIELTVPEGRMNLSNGPTTVGPETTSTAPSTSATSQERSKSR